VSLALLEYFIAFFVIAKSIRHADDSVMTNEIETTKLHKQDQQKSARLPWNIENASARTSTFKVRYHSRV
jgi:hypothetical protein